MQIVKKDQRQKFENSPECIVYEYPHHNQYIDCATAEINGRYPEKGYIVNKICQEMIYVMSGKVTITTETQTIDLEEGDSVIIEAQEKYFWEGNVKVVISCTPPFSPEQHAEVD